MSVPSNPVVVSAYEANRAGLNGFSDISVFSPQISCVICFSAVCGVPDSREAAQRLADRIP